MLVNNAGYGSYGAIEDVPPEEGRRRHDQKLQRHMLSGPELIAKAVTWRRTRTRYLIGFGAKPMVWTHKLFENRVFNLVIKDFS